MENNFQLTIQISRKIASMEMALVKKLSMYSFQCNL